MHKVGPNVQMVNSLNCIYTSYRYIMHLFPPRLSLPVPSYEQPRNCGPPSMINLPYLPMCVLYGSKVSSSHMFTRLKSSI